MQDADRIPDRVLVAYATIHGSTAGVADRIGATLHRRGLHVDVRAVDEVRDVAGYDAVVFGSPVYDQRWLAPAEQFARANAAALARRPLWLFSVGTFGDRKAVIGPIVKREPRDIDEFRRTLRPQDYRVFAGVIHRQQWPRFSRLFFHAFGGRFGDNRDWPAIEAWAIEIGESLDHEPLRSAAAT